MPRLARNLPESAETLSSLLFLSTFPCPLHLRFRKQKLKIRFCLSSHCSSLLSSYREESHWFPIKSSNAIG